MTISQIKENIKSNAYISKHKIKRQVRENISNIKIRYDKINAYFKKTQRENRKMSRGHK